MKTKSMAKKILATIFALTAALSFTACTKQEDVDKAVKPVSEQVTTIKATISEMQTLDSTLDGYIDTLEGKVSTLETSLASVNADLEALEENSATKAALTETKTALESEIAAIKTDIQTLKDKDVTLENKITALETAVSTEVAAAKNWANTTFATKEACDTLKTEINATIATLQGKVQGLETSVQTLNTAVTALQTQVQENTEKIAEMEKQLHCLNKGGHALSDAWMSNENGTHSKACADCSYVLTENCSLTWASQGEGVYTSACSACLDSYEATVTLGAYDNIYSGTEKKPSVTLVIDGETLTENVDYELAYADNTYVGTATVTITLKGTYSGTITESFEIIQDPSSGGFDGEWVTL